MSVALCHVSWHCSCFFPLHAVAGRVAGCSRSWASIKVQSWDAHEGSLHSSALIVETILLPLKQLPLLWDVLRLEAPQVHQICNGFHRLHADISSPTSSMFIAGGAGAAAAAAGGLPAAGSTGSWTGGAQPQRQQRSPHHGAGTHTNTAGSPGINHCLQLNQ